MLKKVTLLAIMFLVTNIHAVPITRIVNQFCNPITIYFNENYLIKIQPNKQIDFYIPFSCGNFNVIEVQYENVDCHRYRYGTYNVRFKLFNLDDNTFLYTEERKKQGVGMFVENYWQIKKDDPKNSKWYDITINTINGKKAQQLIIGESGQLILRDLF